MKHKLNALLLLVAVPVLMAGINMKMFALAAAGIALIVISAGEILVRSILSHK